MTGAAPAAAASVKQPATAPTVANVRVVTVPDQVFKFLDPQGQMLKTWTK